MEDDYYSYEKLIVFSCAESGKTSFAKALKGSCFLHCQRIDQPIHQLVMLMILLITTLSMVYYINVNVLSLVLT